MDEFPNHKKFDSFVQFAIHINFLQTQPSQGNCECKVCLKQPSTSQSAQDPAPARIVRPADSETDVDSDVTIKVKDDVSPPSKDGEDSDATISAEDDDSDYVEDRRRKPKKGKKPAKRALSSKPASKKPSKRARVRGNKGGNDDSTDVNREEES